jgi:hypothetical protein
MNNFKAILISFAAVMTGLSLLAFTADWLHPRLACTSFEKSYWKDRDEAYRFERVSSFFWSSLCRDTPRVVIISASEGTGNLSFAQEAANNGILAHEFTGAHRGLKTLAYLLNSAPNPERLEKLHLLAIINPVYFSFAARTDASSVSMTAISNLSYFARLPSFHQKWDEFLLSSFFIGLKSYFDELMLFKTAKPRDIKYYWPLVKPPSPDEYDFERNMLKKLTGHYTSFESKFSSRVEPARFLMKQVVDFAKAHADLHVCYVMLPVNVKNLKYFHRDADQIQKEMIEAIYPIPKDARVSLNALSEEPGIFQDPMHLTSWGKHRVMDEILKSPCGEKVFGGLAR